MRQTADKVANTRKYVPTAIPGWHIETTRNRIIYMSNPTGNVFVTDPRSLFVP